MRERERRDTVVVINHDVVRAALKSLQTVAALAHSPLNHIEAIQSQSNRVPGHALKTWLIEGIESLKPTGDPDWHTLAWQPYLILRELHLRDSNHERVMAQLAVSRAQHFRLYAQAIDALTMQLQQMAATAQPITTPHQLLAPIPTTHCIGRAAVLDEIKSLLRTKGPRCWIAIHGLPGVGKTEALAQIAHDSSLRQVFPNSVWWLSLGQSPDIASILRSLAKAIGISIDAHQPHADLMRAIRDHIKDWRCLLLLDDVWSVDAAQSFDVGCSILVATRFPEVAARVAGQHVIVLKELDEVQSVDLLRQFAPNVVDNYPEEINHIIGTTGGLPMALTLVGHLLAQIGHAAQPRRVRQVLAQLDQAPFRLHLNLSNANVPSAQPSRSLFAIIAASDAALSETSRHMLYALSIFPPKPNSFSEDVALSVGAADPAALDELVDLGLIETPLPGRYAMHQTVADYAAMQATDYQHRQRMADSIAQFINVNAEQYDVLASELANIMVGLTILQQTGEHTRLLYAVNALFPYLDSRAMWARAEALYAQLTSTFVAPYSPEQLQALLNAGNVAFQLNRLEQAEAYAQACQFEQSIAPIELKHEALHLLTRIACERADFDAGLAYAQEALSVAKHSQQADLIASAQAMTAMVQGMRGRLAQARQVFGEDESPPDTLLQRMQTKAQIGQTQARLVLGITAFFAGKLQEAERSLTDTLTHCQRLRHPRLTTATQAILSAVLHARGRYADALSLATDGLSMAETLEQADMAAMLQHSLGLVALSRGEWVLADTVLAQAVTQARTAKLHPVLATVLTAQARLHIERERVDEAHIAIQEALALSRLRFQQIGPIAIVGRLAALTGKFAEAHAHCTKAIKSCNGPFSSATLTAFALLQRGECRLDAGEVLLAEADFEQALMAAQKVGYPEFVGMAQFGLARAARGQGKRDMAQRIADQSLRTFARLGHGYEGRVVAFISRSH